MSGNDGKVVKVLNEMELVIDLGFEKGLEIDDEILIYTLGEEIIDPDSGESLGQLERVIGYGKVTHAQDKFCTVRSSDYEIVEEDDGYSRSPILGYQTKKKKVKKEKPFNNPQLRNLARKI